MLRLAANICGWFAVSIFLTLYNKLSVTPVFNEGDLFLFDEYYVHSTQFHFGDHEPGVYRYAIETWFHPRCTVDNDYSTPMAWGW